MALVVVAATMVTGLLAVKSPFLAEAERRLQPARLRGELAAFFFEDGIKKLNPKPHQMDCPVGWVRQVEAAEGPDAFCRRLGHLIRGGWVRHGTMCLGHGRCRSVLRLYGGQILEAHGAACRKMNALGFGGSKMHKYAAFLHILDCFYELDQKIKISEKQAEIIVLC